MSDPGCTQFEDAGRRAGASAAAAALWREHRETCAACRAQERTDALVRASMRMAPPPMGEERFTERVMARLGTTSSPRSAAGARWFLILCGGFATAASAAILASLSTPLVDPGTLRTLVLGGALISPIALMSGPRRGITRLLGSL